MYHTLLTFYPLYLSIIGWNGPVFNIFGHRTHFYIIPSCLWYNTLSKVTVTTKRIITSHLWSWINSQHNTFGISQQTAQRYLYLMPISQVAYCLLLNLCHLTSKPTQKSKLKKRCYQWGKTQCPCHSWTKHLLSSSMTFS